METRKLSLVFAISGFIYTGVLFFVFLLVFGIYDLSAFFKSIKEYLPYISIIIFFLAFVIGIISETILQKIVFLLLRKPFDAKHQIDILKSESDHTRNAITISFDKLVILRHFLLGPFLLMVTSGTWVLLSDFENKVKISQYIFSIGGFLFIFSLVAYLIRRKIHNELINAIKNNGSHNN